MTPHRTTPTLDEGGGLRPATPDDFQLMKKSADGRDPWGLFLQPNTEYLWLTEKEWKALVPADPVKGGRYTGKATPILSSKKHSVVIRVSSDGTRGTIRYCGDRPSGLA